MLKLYNWKLSPNAFKVRVVLHELNLPFEMEEIEILHGAGQKPDYLKLNPNGKVPVLEDGALALWESNAIILYLARKAGRLLPGEPAGQALVDQWLNWQAAHYYQPLIGLALEKMIKPMFQQPPDDAVVLTQSKDFMRMSLLLENHLAQYEYLAGELSVADFGVASTLYPRKTLGIDVSGFKFLHEWLTKLEARESWQKAL